MTKNISLLYLPEVRYRVCCSDEELQEICEDSADIFKHNMLDRHMDRSDLTYEGSKYSILDGFCYEEFLVLIPNKTDNE